MSTQIYKSELVRCFNLAFGISHRNAYNFSNKELLNSTPDHINAYLSFEVFGTSAPLDSDTIIQGGPNSIEYAKKIFYIQCQID